jgi:RNA polymerase sigma-70 factor (sigma-E family)
VTSLAADAAVDRTALRADPATPATWDADAAVTELYTAHYRSLVRLAVLFVRDVETAEEVVQDSFVAMHGAWRRLRDPDRALAYLRQTIVNRSRTALRRRRTVEKHAPDALDDVPSAEHSALRTLEHDRIMAALHGLARRQREVLVLRYYADLSEAEIADALRISRGAVKSHASRGMAALRSSLEDSA